MKNNQNNQNISIREGKTGEKLLNPNLNQYRLNNEQRIAYTNLFNENASSNGKVKRENFLPLLGFFGTKIAQDFSDRMFLVLSKGNQEITLEQYLSYIDTYHYGDIHERCLYTCKLMDTKQKGKIELEDFQSYINLIISTVKKVNNTLTKKDLMSEKDIEYLFYHISQGKLYFTYNDFENIYQEKPELVSWFDYFKNDKEDILLIIHEFIPVILKIFNDFIINFMNDLFLLLDKEEEINLELIFQKVLNYSNNLEKKLNEFIKKVSKFTITTAFINFNKNHNKSLFYLQNHIFESSLNKKNQNNIDINSSNVDDYFKEIKRSLYKNKEKEILLDNQNEYYQFKNEKKHFAEKFVKKSAIFRNKNFKFFDNYNNLRNSNNNLIRRNPLKIDNINNNNLIDYNHNIININNSIDNFKLSSNLNNNLNNFNYNHANTMNAITYVYQNTYPLKDKKINYKNINDNYNTIEYNNYNNYEQNTLGIPSYLNSNLESSTNPMTNFYSLKETQKLKQLLFCSREIIEKALETNTAFNNCYRWISENYLSEYIKKKIKEERLKEKKKFKKRISVINIPRKVFPLKKKIIGASEKSFEILFNMIMGIQIAVQATPNFTIKNKEDLKKYLTKMLYSVQTIYLGKGQEESYLLKEFGGVIFNNIRLYLGINKEDFIRSISPQDFITELMISSQTIFEELCSTGSSGSLLYYTRDGEFIVKTISKKEYKFLKKMIGEYFFYFKENPLSFLPKLLGCYVLKRKFKKKITNIYFIVMTNVFATEYHIDLRFDLKGSTIGRRVLTGTQIDSKIFSNGDMALKDLDFNKINERVYVGAKREIILEQIKKDIEFLYSINSNDYSLLLGIHYFKNTERYSLSRTATIKTTEYKKDNLSMVTDYSKENIFSDTIETESNISSEKLAVERINKLKTIYDFEDGGMLSDNKKRIYYFGIIDILTEFNSLKHAEYLYKKIKYCSENMSCIPPNLYRDRFYNYLNYVFSPKIQNDYGINQNIINNDFIKGEYNVDKFGGITSSKYKINTKDNPKGDNYTMEESLHKF